MKAYLGQQEHSEEIWGKPKKARLNTRSPSKHTGGKNHTRQQLLQP